MAEVLIREGGRILTSEGKKEIDLGKLVLREVDFFTVLISDLHPSYDEVFKNLRHSLLKKVVEKGRDYGMLSENPIKEETGRYTYVANFYDNAPYPKPPVSLARFGSQS